MKKSLGTAVVTGASTGIGAVYADRLAKRGYDLVLVARDEAKLNTLAERLRGEAGVKVRVLKADLTDKGDLNTVEDLLRTDASVTLLVNNAGAARLASFATLDLDAEEKIIQLNVTALMRLSGAVVPAFLARGTGSIINVASVLAFAPEISPTVYSATKSFVVTLSQGLNHELASKGLYVQAMLPGATLTEIWERGGMQAPPTSMQVDDLVDAALLGFDRRETVTIPPLQNESLWSALNDARLAMIKDTRNALPGARYS